MSFLSSVKSTLLRAFSPAPAASPPPNPPEAERRITKRSALIKLNDRIEASVTAGRFDEARSFVVVEDGSLDIMSQIMRNIIDEDEDEAKARK